MTIKAKIVADSISPIGKRITTFQLYYPRFIHAEFMTHRQFSRNASSSRAIPIKTTIERVKNDPAFPVRWGANGKGMQDHGELSKAGQDNAKSIWLAARDDAVLWAEALLDSVEVPHKQIVNRILEPFSHIEVVVTSTEFSNWFGLRQHKDADPTIQHLANQMRDVYDNSIPKELENTDWHVPYVTEEDISEARKIALSVEANDLDIKTWSDERRKDFIYNILIKISVARCARVSYLTHNKKRPSFVEDIKLADRLIGSTPKHASPAEHQAKPDPLFTSPLTVYNRKSWGNLVGWHQFRKMIPNEEITNTLGDEN